MVGLLMMVGGGGVAAATASMLDRRQMAAPKRQPFTAPLHCVGFRAKLLI
jgi:hypothetical protein